MTLAARANPVPLKDCPICHSTDGRCRERDGMVLCMSHVDGVTGEKIAGYEYHSRTNNKAGDWGIWRIPNEDKARLKQLAADRISLELSQDPHEPTRRERDEAYQKVLSQLVLAPCDRVDLEARGFTTGQIEAIGFRSAEKWQTLRDEVNWRVPGIGPTGRNLYTPWDGGAYLCPIRDIDGDLVALQARLRKLPEGNKNKYRWLSSSDRRRPNAPRTQVEGELPLAIYQPEGCDRSTIWLVEGTGPKPALTAFRTHCLTIGASGAQWASAPRTLRQTLNKLAVSRLILAPDAGSIQPDKHGNQHTLRRYTRLRDLLKDWGYGLDVAWWGQAFKPEAKADQRRLGDIDEIDSLEGVEFISFDRLRQMAAQAMQAAQLSDRLAEIGKPFPVPREVVEPEPLPEGASEQEKLEAAISHYSQVEAQGNPFATFPLINGIKREFGLNTMQVAALVAYQRDRDREGSGLTDTADELIETFSEIEQRAEGVTLPGVPCGFYDLDAMTQGLQRSDLVVAAGRPSMGKTGWVMGVARNISAVQRLPVAVFSLEMSKRQLIYRLLSAEAGIESSRLRTGRLAAQEWAPLGMAINKLSEMPLFFDDTPNISVAEIRSKSRRLQAEQGALGTIIIDYLQLIEGQGDNRVQELSGITRQLKALARELNVPVIALSQLSRGVEARTNKRPMMSDLRESGAIEQDADLIMMLYREEYYDPDTPDRGIAEIIVTKHRSGPTGTMKLLFEPQFARFRNLARG